MKVCRGGLAIPLALFFAVAGASACSAPPPMSAADHAFDKAFSAALADDQPIAFTSIEPGDWSLMCVIGEDRPASMLPDQAARSGEEAFESLFDAAAFWSGPSSAVAFAYDDGVEVRPVNGFHVNMGEPLNRCVPRAQAVLVRDGGGGWRFRDFSGSELEPINVGVECLTRAASK
jgi:hypothetical protein